MSIYQLLFKVNHLYVANSYKKNNYSLRLFIIRDNNNICSSNTKTKMGITLRRSCIASTATTTTKSLPC
jgi:hypothetical protein